MKQLRKSSILQRVVDQNLFRIIFAVSILFFPLGKALAQDDDWKSIADRLVDEARSLTSFRKFDSALVVYDSANRIYVREKLMADYYLTEISKVHSLYGLGKSEEAFQLLEKVRVEGAEIKGENILFEVYRNKAILFENQLDFTSALVNYDLAEEHFEDNGEKRSIERLATLYIGKGVSYGNTGRLYPAFKQWEIAYHMFDSIGVHDSRMAQVLANLGGVTNYMGLMEQAVTYLEEGAALMGELYGSRDHPVLHQIYFNLSSNYQSIGAMQKAKQYMLRAQSITLKIDENNPVIIEEYIHLADIHSNLGEYDEAMSVIDLALERAPEILGKGHAKIGEVYLILAEVNRDRKAYDEAVVNYQKSIDILENSQGGDPRQLASAYGSLGTSEVALGKIAPGLKNLNRAVEISESNTNGTGTDYAFILNQWLDGLIAANRLDEALLNTQKAISANVAGFDSDDPNEHPTIENVYNFNQLLMSLIKKASIQELLAENNIGALENALETSRLATQAADKIDYQQDNYRDKFAARSQISKLNEMYARISKKLFDLTGKNEYIEMVHTAMERNKANLIISNLQSSDALNSLELPDSLVQQKEIVREKIAYLESELYKERAFNDSKDTAKIDLFEKDLFDWNKAEEELDDLIKSVNPAFYQFKIEKNFINLEQVQKELIENDEVLYHYQLSKQQLLLLQISREKVEMIVHEIDDDFTQKVKEFVRQCQNPSVFGPTFLELSDYLVEMLSLNATFLEGKSKLTIIPDGLLGLVPFDALAMAGNNSATDFRSIDYLMYHYQISYANSSTLLRLQKEADSRTKLSVAAFAPTFDEKKEVLNEADTIRSGLSDLSWTKSEVDNIASYFQTERFMEGDASEAKFKSIANSSPIIHVATHGLLDDRAPLFSKLVFSQSDRDSLNDGFINTRELFAMNIPAEMVVLSACNTGFGDILSGEGVISLANGFFYAGSKSVVMTLWQANDRSTANIMGSFYENLSNGDEKSAALRKAKMDYLESAQGVVAHPYYWAHFVANGDDHPLVEESAKWPIFLLMLVVVIVIARRKRSQRGSVVSANPKS